LPEVIFIPVEKSRKKPVSVQKKRTITSKRGRRKKPTLDDGVRAALMAAVFISLAVFISAAVLVIRSFIPGVVPAVGNSGSSRPEETPGGESPVPGKAPAGGTAVPERPGGGESPVPGRGPAGGTAVPERPGGGRAESRGTLVFMIDDAGNNLRDLEPFLRFPGPLTIAVLPGLPYSAEAARRIRAAGKEVFLHQPMEALGGQDPGPGAVYAGMSLPEIRAVVERNLVEIGPVAGMNNHQGSRVTMDEEVMETILAICREQGICFLDSRTTADTAAPVVAARMGIKIGERDVFLDNIQEKAAMMRSVGEGLRKAERKGAVVMIGHTWSSELAPVLESVYRDVMVQGYSFSTVSRIIAGDRDL
jgi:polysaccharide deacetylase 2 family uncharacterized protein YibQ